MKKFYSLLLVVAAILTGFSASANKTLTFKTDDASNGLVSLSYPVSVGDSEYTTTTLTTEGLVIETGDYANLTLQCADGWYVGTVKASNYSLDRTTSANSSENLNSGMFSDGDVVTITVHDGANVPKMELTFVGEPSTYYVEYYGSSYYPNEDGTMNLTYGEYSSVTIYPTEGYRLMKVTDQLGNSYSISGSCYVYTGSLPAKESTLTIEVLDESTIEKHTFTATAYGDMLYKISMRDQNWNYIYFNNDGESMDIEFEDGTTYSISNSYSEPIYRVVVNDVDLQPNAYDTYEYTPTDGDNLEIYLNFPAVPVPFNVVIGDGADTSIIKEFRYQNEIIGADVWSADDFQPMLGKSIYIEFNTADYDDLTVKLNGADVTSSYLSMTLNDEAGYTLELNGVRAKPYIVTIVVEDPASINIYKGYTNDTFTLTGQVTELEIPKSETNLQFKAADGYRFVSYTVDGITSTDNYYYVEGDCSIEIEVEKINRDREIVFYLQPGQEWSYKAFILSNRDYNLRYEVALVDGYNHIKYGDFDLPFYIAGYPYPYFYYNDESLGQNYQFPEYEKFNDDDVIKMFLTEPETSHNVTYTIADGVNVQVLHDHVKVIDNPANHVVLPGTEIHIVPVATFDAASAPVEVKVNGVKVAADEDGKYTIAVNDDTEIAVTKGDESGVENITVADNDDETTYNLQGVRVENPSTGIYIRGGKKIIVK